MGFRCPVCSDPQADAVHLANHLAFTAMVRGGDHEEWLDEHVPDWGQLDDEGLGEVAAEYAQSVEFPQMFEDTTGRSQGAHRHQHSPPVGDGMHSGVQAEQFDAETREILERARQLTRERRTTRGATDESAEETQAEHSGAEDA